MPRSLRPSRIAAALAIAGVVLTAIPALAAREPLTPSVPLPHDPRTTAKKLSQGLEVDGAGKLAIDYKALHFNPEMFERAKKNAGFMNNVLNGNVWGKLGTAKLGFEIDVGGKKLAPGDYDFGINMTAEEEFSVVFWKGKEKTAIPLQMEREQKAVPFLTVTLMATDEVDVFDLEARCGPFRGTIDVKVPYLDEEHEHEAAKEGGAPPKHE